MFQPASEKRRRANRAGLVRATRSMGTRLKYTQQLTGIKYSQRSFHFPSASASCPGSGNFWSVLVAAMNSANPAASRAALISSKHWGPVPAREKLECTSTAFSYEVVQTLGACIIITSFVCRNRYPPMHDTAVKSACRIFCPEQYIYVAHQELLYTVRCSPQASHRFQS